MIFSVVCELTVNYCVTSVCSNYSCQRSVYLDDIYHHREVEIRSGHQLGQVSSIHACQSLQASDSAAVISLVLCNQRSY